MAQQAFQQVSLTTVPRRIEASDTEPYVVTAAGSGILYGDTLTAVPATSLTNTSTVMITQPQLFTCAADGAALITMVPARAPTRAATVAGIPADASFTGSSFSGATAIDTTNSKLYVRVGSTWKGVTVA